MSLSSERHGDIGSLNDVMEVFKKQIGYMKNLDTIRLHFYGIDGYCHGELEFRYGKFDYLVISYSDALDINMWKRTINKLVIERKDDKFVYFIEENKIGKIGKIVIQTWIDTVFKEYGE